jgi:pentatricopeptide repeat protein
VVAELRQRRVQPNVRMVNTLLRGCLLHGDPDRALEVLRGMTNSGKAVGFVDASLAKSAKKNKKKRNDQDGDSRREFVKTALPGAGSSAAATWGEVANSFVWQPTACDGSSFEYACSLLAQALRGDEAERLVQWASKQAKAPPPKPQAVNAKQTPAALAAAARRGDNGAGAPAAAPKDEGGGGEGGGESGAGSGGAGGLELHAARAHALVGDWHRARPLLLRAHKLGKKHATAAAAAAEAAETAAEAAAVAEAAAAGWAQAGETDGGETEGGWGEGGGSQTGGARATGGAGGGQRGGRRAEGNAERERSNAVSNPARFRGRASRVLLSVFSCAECALCT